MGGIAGSDRPGDLEPVDVRPGDLTERGVTGSSGIGTVAAPGVYPDGSRLLAPQGSPAMAAMARVPRQGASCPFTSREGALPDAERPEGSRGKRPRASPDTRRPRRGTPSPRPT